MNCKMYASRHFLCSAQGHEKDAQADKQGVEDSQVHRDILEDVKESKVASKRCRANDRGRADRVLE